MSSFSGALCILSVIAILLYCPLVVRSLELAEHESKPCDDLNLELLANNPVVIDIHRNGEQHPCGSVKITSEDFEMNCPLIGNKFDVESFLTRIIADRLDEDSCHNTYDENPSPGFLGYCDRGEAYTPILTDHAQLVRVPTGSSLPCRFFTREGLRIVSLTRFISMAMEREQSCEDHQSDCGTLAHIHLYAVNAGRVFMFAPSFVGETFDLPQVDVSSGLPVFLEVLNTNPRVFEIHNFFSKEESAELVAKAMAETSESHRIKRSTTGTGEKSVFSKRTSESGFDTHGVTAQKIKRRCMATLGFDEYIEGHTDGLQILRYNVSKAYVQHMDYMTDRGGTEAFDFESAFKGGNRYATILLYMTDFEPGEGGETVFSESWPPDQTESERKSLPTALSELRDGDEASMLTRGSWEENMVARCRSKFSVRPNSAKAVLFYSQLPDGKEDKKSMHGGCPVLKPDKVRDNPLVRSCAHVQL